MSTPPRMGPIAALRPKTPPHTPTAPARSRRSVKTDEMIDSELGFNIDPPTAWRMRAITSRGRVGARLQSSEPMPKTVRPMMNIRLRPKRSPREPERSSRQASTNR